MHISVSVTQCGISMDLIGYKDDPIMLALISPSQLTQYRKTLEESNPDMEYATLGQVGLMLGKLMYPELSVKLEQE